MTADYPTIELDCVRRLQVLARAVPGAVYGETHLAAPYDRVWRLISDMDTSMPALLPNFRSWRTVERDGERLRAYAVGHLGLRSMFDVTLRPGICVMQDRRFVGGFAAVAASGGTRFAVLAGVRGPGRHLIGAAFPFGGWLARRIAHRLTTRPDGRP